MRVSLLSKLRKTKQPYKKKKERKRQTDRQRYKSHDCVYSLSLHFVNFPFLGSGHKDADGTLFPCLLLQQVRDEQREAAIVVQPPHVNGACWGLLAVESVHGSDDLRVDHLTLTLLTHSGLVELHHQMPASHGGGL